MATRQYLTLRQEDFCKVYARHPNATRAAVGAGYSAASARNQGYRLLRNPAVAARIAELRTEMAQLRRLGAQAVVDRLETVYANAMENAHCNAALRALHLQARIAGLASRPVGARPGPEGRMTNDDK